MRLVPRRGHYAVLIVVLTLLGSSLAAIPAVAAADLKLSVVGSPFDPNGDGKRDTVRVEIRLPEDGDVNLWIAGYKGARSRTLAASQAMEAGTHAFTWNGRRGDGDKVPYGPYRVKLRVHTQVGLLDRSAWVTRAARVPYAKRPGSIVVALDPGHGGPADGAAYKGLREDAVNLDIALRLEAMLKGAGVDVVMTRRGDRNVSPVGKDLNKDGRYTRVDELIARNDVANEARADIRLAMHNNASTCHCTRGTEMYTHYKRSWSPEGRKLARVLQAEHLIKLKRLPSGYKPRNRGVKSKDFKALKPYHRIAMPRPSLQPSVLAESLFMDWPSEHRILGTGSGRTAIAAAYFDGIARYLAWRPFGLHYEVLDAPTSVKAGEAASIRIRITNTARRVSDGWRLTARVVKKVPRYDGRPRRGSVVAATDIPDGLASGASSIVYLPAVPIPDKLGTWLVKLDVGLGGGDAISRHGVVGPQLTVATKP